MLTINPFLYFRHKALSKNLIKFLFNKIIKRIDKRYMPDNPFVSEKYNTISNDIFLYEKIINSLQNKNPLMIARYGGCEHDLIANTLLYEAGIVKSFQYSYKRLCNNAGFFPNNLKTNQEIFIYAKKFSQIYLDASKQCDVLGTWHGIMSFEKYLIDNFCKQDIFLTHILKLGPNIHEEIPFTYALKDTKVLVIHPFAQTIESQYKKYDKLFTNKKVLPEFNLKTFKAIQTAGGEIDHRFKDWFEALEWMSNEISQIDFDIALIGCGAYGFPLAAKIKQMGKIAIHCGGNLQLLFGIKGKRWEIEQPEVGKELFNEYWVYPNSKETISNASKIEGGCYW